MWPHGSRSARLKRAAARAGSGATYRTIGGPWSLKGKSGKGGASGKSIKDKSTNDMLVGGRGKGGMIRKGGWGTGGKDTRG